MKHMKAKAVLSASQVLIFSYTEMRKPRKNSRGFLLHKKIIDSAVLVDIYQYRFQDHQKPVKRGICRKAAYP